MRKICMIFMLLCSMTVFAMKSSYTGTLSVTVNGETTTINNQVISAADNGNGTATLTISDFTFEGISGTVTIVAKINADGVLSDDNLKVSFSGIPVLTKSFYAPSTVNTSSAEIHLSMKALGKTIKVDYSGN